MSEHYDGSEGRHQQSPEEPVVVRDRRKIDPETGQLRRQPAPAPADQAPAPAGPGLGESIVDDSVSAQSDVERQLAERTADLQRLQAEYANYRKRVERDREAVGQAGKASVVGDLLPLLDDLERAEQHGDLVGAFKAVADKLVAGLQRAGLESFGVEGEPFDPSVHEAVQHNTSPEVAGPTVTVVMRRGYRFGDRVLRAALVGVTDHEPGAEQVAEPVDPPVGGELPIDAEFVDEKPQQ
ncbi:nucleotide exchange factor GrpE [Amycolatopsis nigrescens]|uniref:nucleotide exchange factor GrpE n=1 Tax=Amycolatopsis nigrescens TaxID=381445 RepID=UPI00036B4A8D|nr:nucleotide exchange factor GrpE [Amycolatopsis nigrescens]